MEHRTDRGNHYITKRIEIGDLFKYILHHVGSSDGLLDWKGDSSSCSRAEIKTFSLEIDEHT